MLIFCGSKFSQIAVLKEFVEKFCGCVLPMRVAAHRGSLFQLNKFRKRFQIHEIHEIKDPRNISAI